MPASTGKQLSVAMVLFFALLVAGFVYSREFVTASSPAAKPARASNRGAKTPSQEYGVLVNRAADESSRSDAGSAEPSALTGEVLEDEQTPHEHTTLSGRVISIDAALLPPFRVHLEPVAGGGAESGDRGSLVTDSSGAFDFGKRRAGDWRLAVREHQAGSRRATPNVALPPGVELLLGTAGFSTSTVLAERELTLGTGPELEVELIVGRESSESASLWGYLAGALPEEFPATVRLAGEDERGDPFEFERTPDAAGRFDFGFVPPGLMNLVVMSSPNAPNPAAPIGHVSVDLEVGERRELRIELASRCTVIFEIVDARTGGRIEHAAVKVANLETGSSSTFHKTARDPAVLESGTYALLARAGGYRFAAQGFVLLDSELETVVRVYLDPSASVPSTLVDQGGLPMTEFSVSIHELEGVPLNSNMYLNTRTDERGIFDAGIVDPGDYVVVLAGQLGGEYSIVRGKLSLTGRPGDAVFVPDE